MVSLNKSEYVDPNVYLYEHQSMEYGPKASGCEDSISVDLAIYVYTGLICTCIVTLLCRSIYYYRTAMNASKNLHNKMFSSLLHAPMRFFDINPSGRILNRFSRDIGMIDEILPRIILEALQVRYLYGINSIINFSYILLDISCHDRYSGYGLYN